MLSNYKRTRGHNEFPGYSWKACPEFDYRAVITSGVSIAPVPPKPVPNTYKIQQGDTFWSIAKELDGITVDDLIKFNADVDPSKLQIGQVINLAEVSKPMEKPKPSSPNLKVDGYWGAATTTALQQALKTPIDGKISGQSKNAVTDALINTVKIGNGGSTMVRALQRKLKVTADGRLGPQTIRALQKHLGTPVDGKISEPSVMVKELQSLLNNGTF